ncbi:hypothetical protein [Sphingomonas xinjiangensis]|uniref:Uncharacterized protein n=1 Tax=Sphingomonas xinjiangensis TaxID=643568 RepID=A0A840YTI0_9SPHN|nr:hypothetical protein [Sphingomonas xinjiangensis]MBB5712947.1 hypothetical protein [Sphingomonas xinjiangensis]
MRQSPVNSSLLTTQAERSAVTVPQKNGFDLTSLVAAAIEIGRMPGEPAAVLPARQRPLLLGYLFGRKTHRPLADPRLEVIRAISASLTRGIDTIRADLITAAAKVGWSRNDLSLMFPAVSLRVAS